MDAKTWEQELGQRLMLFGHRNWIVIADSAYPAQTAAGIETVVVPEEQLALVGRVLAAVKAAGHVRARVHVDAELPFVDEVDAPGVTAYRQKLKTVLQGANIEELAHEEIIRRLDRAAQLVQILILKTPLKIPYTSVFLELDCGYWGDEAEQKMRRAIKVVAASGAK